jgi:hypothetical protein
MANLKISCDSQSIAHQTSVIMTGDINEDSDFRAFKADQAQVVLDLGGITSINSTGIRLWISWIKEIEGKKIELVHCPKVLVDQMNMVAGFLPEGAKVRSFYVPYFEEKSGVEKSLLFSVGKEILNGQVHPPAVVEDDAGEPMTMDVFPSKYFRFVKNFT